MTDDQSGASLRGADGWMTAATYVGEESPGFMETRCRLIADEGDLRESATESKPLIYK